MKIASLLVGLFLSICPVLRKVDYKVNEYGTESSYIDNQEAPAKVQ